MTDGTGNAALAARLPAAHPFAAAADIVVAAPAKINLALHVVGRRADGYHLLDSLVAFAMPDDGDAVAVRFAPSSRPAAAAGSAADTPRPASDAPVGAATAAAGSSAKMPRTTSSTNPGAPPAGAANGSLAGTPQTARSASAGVATAGAAALTPPASAVGTWPAEAGLAPSPHRAGVVEADGAPALAVVGPFAAGVPLGPDNIAVRAAQLVGGIAAMTLWKGYPVASGIGGGSADAAAVLRAAALRRGLDPTTLATAALSLGADVPVCLAGRAARMGGIGERLAPVALPAARLVLVNPGVPVATAAVFAGLAARDNPPMPEPPPLPDPHALAAFLRLTRNDLEGPAVALAPPIAEALAALAGAPGCLLARMSGSGATVFGLFPSAAAQNAAAAALARPGWWVRAATILR